MSREKQPRITIPREEEHEVAVIQPTMKVRVCAECDGYAFDYYKKEIRHTICPCGTDRPVTEKQVPMTDENFQEIRAACERLVPKK
jgi:hypothetical protein